MLSGSLQTTTRRRVWLMSAVAVAVVFALSPAGCGGEKRPGGPLPDTIAGQELGKIIRGAAAGKFIYRMHGRPVGETISAIGYYGAAEQVVLYVSWFVSEETAERALRNMADKMAGGSMGFSPPAAVSGPAGRYFMSRGMGCEHVFYRRGCAVVWLQAVPELLPAGFSELCGFSFERRDRAVTGAYPR